MNNKPLYISLYEDGILDARIEELEKHLKSCDICPHKCGVDRTKGEKGVCQSGMLPVVAYYAPDDSQETPLVGRNKVHTGSGTIQFSYCNMECVYCKNYDISHLGWGNETSYYELAEMMVALQDHGCLNINLISPTHIIHALLRALPMAIEMGLSIPLIYNSGGYDSVEILKLLDGIIDIYLPDFKYSHQKEGYTLSNVLDYPGIAKKAIIEMHRQVGDLLINNQGIAEKGLLVRHLVLPQDRAFSKEIIKWLALLPGNTYVSIMEGYKPEYRAREDRILRRKVDKSVVDDLRRYAASLGLRVDTTSEGKGAYEGSHGHTGSVNRH